MYNYNNNNYLISYCTRCCDYVYDNYFENEKYVIENLDLADISTYPIKSKYDVVEFETNQRCIYYYYYYSISINSKFKRKTKSIFKIKYF